MFERRITGRSYLFTWLALLALSVLTLVLSFAPLGRFHVPVAVIIAGIKGTLIILIFMHLAEQQSVNRVVLLFWLLLLGILIALTAGDVATRYITQRPPISG